jgi:hypothetical protein
MRRFLLVSFLAAFAFACDSSSGGTDATGDVIIGGDQALDSEADGTTEVTDKGPDGETVNPDVKDPGGEETTPPDVTKEDLVTLDDGMAEEVGPTCQQCPYFYDCIQDCPAGAAGQACQQDCLAQLCAQDQQDFQAFYTCLNNNGCNTKTTDEEFMDCLDQFCIDPYFKCFSGDKYATCADLNACLNSCPDDDPATTEVKENQECWNGCFSDASYQANVDFEAQRDCVLGVCTICLVDNPTADQDVECNVCWNNTVFDECADQYKKCNTFGTQYTTCIALNDCLNACPDDDPKTTDVLENRVCWNACFDGGTFDANADFQGQWDCAYAKCTVCLKAEPTAEEDAECNDCINTILMTDCATEYQKCATFGTDYPACVDLNACLNSCPVDDPMTAVEEDVECWRACFDGGTFQANKDFTLFYDCIDIACPVCGVTNPTTQQQAECDACYWTAVDGGACKDLFAACQPIGDKNCPDTWACIIACEDAACSQACYAAATAHAQNAANAFAVCLGPVCTDQATFDTCQETQKTGTCKTQWDTCAADAPAPAEPTPEPIPDSDLPAT